VLESDPEVGGRVRTVARDGYLIDTGATALAASYHGYKALARELGEEVKPCPPFVGIFRDGEVHHLRLDRMVRSGLGTKMLSRQAKLRAGVLAVDVALARVLGRLDYADMRKAAPLDTETAREYGARRLSRELDDYLCEPVVRTMLMADGDTVSKVELFSGLANIFASRVEALAGGQGRVPTVLAERVGVELESPVERVTEVEGGVEVTWLPHGDEGSTEVFDACVVACPLPVALEICPGQRDLLGPIDRALGYTQCVTVAVGTTRTPDSPAFLVQMPSREDHDVALMFLDHNKAADRAPAGHGLIGCCWEASAAARMMEEPDELIVDRTLASVLRVFPELNGSVEMTEVTRWRRALPHTRVGGYRAIGEFNARLDPRAGIQFAADYMSAAGQNTAVEFGTRAAENLDNQS
jgi:oxygen-dependent protoporphyrinogen oxidase